MYRTLFRRINIVIYLIIALGVVTAQTTLFNGHLLDFLQPDLLLIMVVYLGFRRDIVEGAILTAVIAIFQRAHSSAGEQFYLTVYLYAFLIAKLTSRTVVTPDFFSTVGIVAGITALKKIGFLILLGTYGKSSNALGHFIWHIVPSMLVAGLLGPMFFKVFMHIDLLTYKDEHSEDEYDINKGL